MKLQDLKNVERATVLKAGRPAAELLRARDAVVFRYLEGYAGPPVASTLPVGPETRSASPGALPPFFAGLLPEGRRLTALRTAIKTSADDDVSLLLAVGWDAIGDVVVLPSGEPAPEPSPDGPPLAEARFAEWFARVLSRDPEDRVALPGVQPKLSGRLLSLPLSWGGVPSILKLDPPEYPHLVENEAFFLAAARTSGLRTTETEVVRDATGAAGLLVRRFDRVQDGTGWRSLAQEDGCQVLGRYPADKYRVSAEEVVAALSRVTGAPLVAARELLRQLAFAWITGNGDAHAKNLSVLQAADGEWEVSPAYDAPSTHPYGDTTFALPVNGRTEDLGRKDFVALGAAAGLPERAVRSALDDLLDAVPRWSPGLDGLPFDARRRHRLKRAIARRVDRLR